MTERQVKFALMAIICVAAWLRLHGIDHGLPYPFRSDEESMLGGALRMLELRNPIPAFNPEEMEILNYPVIVPYLLLMVITPFLLLDFAISGFPPLDLFARHVFEQMGTIFLLSRLTSVVISLLTLMVVYRLARLLFKSSAISLACSALFAIEFYAVFTSHFVRHWPMTTLMIWLAVLYAIQMTREPRLRHYSLTAVVAGIGFGTSYALGGLGGIAGVVAHLINWRRGTVRLFDRRAWAMAGVFLLIAIVVFVTHPNAVLRLTVGGVANLDEAKTIPGLFDSLGFYATKMTQADLGVSLMAVIGVILGTLDRATRPIVLGLAGAILFYFVALYFLVSNEGRYSLGAMPGICLLAGFGLCRLANIFASVHSRVIVVMGALVPLVFQLAVSVHIDRMLAADDTRELAAAWIANNAPEDARIANAMQNLEMPQSLAALEQQASVYPDSIRAYERLQLRLSTDPRIDQAQVFGDRYVINIGDQSFIEVEDFEKPGFIDWLIENDYRYYIGQYRDESRISPLLAELQATRTPVARFNAGSENFQPPYLQTTILVTGPISSFFQFDRFGPVVEIFDLKM